MLNVDPMPAHIQSVNNSHTYLFLFPAGVQKCARGGAVGLGIAAVWCLVTSGDRIKQMVGMRWELWRS